MGRDFASGIASMVGSVVIAAAFVIGMIGFGLGILVFRMTDSAACVDFTLPQDATHGADMRGM
mgnify:CR=1 FL=1